MATPADMVGFLAERLELPKTSLIQVDRQLAIGGYRRKSGRGPNVVQVNAADVAHHLIAIMGSQLFAAEVTGAVETVKRYADLPVRHPPGARLLKKRTRLAGLVALGTEHTFHQALTALIEAHASGDAARAQTGQPVIQFEIRVFVRGPEPSAMIMLSNDRAMPAFHYEARRQGMQSAPKHAFNQERVIGHDVIAALGQLIARSSEAT